MNVIKNIGNEIKEINTNFLLNLENYENVFFNTLNEPNNNIYISELSRKNGILENIDSRAFVVKNQMNKLIDNMTNEMNSMNTDMERIKKENIILKEKAKILHKDVLTSDGLYDGEFEWYREQMKVVIVMLVGIIIGTVMFMQMKLSIKDIIIALITVIIVGTLFTKIANYIVSKMNSVGNNIIGKQ